MSHVIHAAIATGYPRIDLDADWFPGKLITVQLFFEQAQVELALMGDLFGRQSAFLEHQ
jgi:hypothetical protein